MAIVIKGIKYLTKKGAERLALKGKRKLINPTKRAANKRRAKQKAYEQRRSPLKYNIHAGGGKGPVPIKKQSPIKSTLSGRIYSSIKKGPGSNFRLDPTTGSAVAEFQSRVRDLIGLDQISIRAAHRATHIARERRKNRLKKK